MDTSLVRCTRCQRDLPRDRFAKHTRSKNGLQCHCKDCQSAAYYAWREINPYPRKTPLPDKTLTRKEKDHLYYLANRDKIIAQTREYAANNKETLSEAAKNYRKRNLERLKAYRKRWYLENRDRELIRSRAYYQEHKEQHAEYGKQWRKNNPERVRAIGRASMNRRRSLMMSAEGKYTMDDARNQYKRQKGRCYWCNKSVKNQYDLDHIVPLSRGGSNWPDNIVIACPHCNRSRSNKLPHEWKIGGRLL